MTRTPEELVRLSVLAKTAEADDLIYREWVRLNKTDSNPPKTSTSAIHAIDALFTAQELWQGKFTA